MLRHYYVTDDLDDLVEVEHELEHQGVDHAQIHVLSEQGESCQHSELQDEEKLRQQDVFYSTEIGAIIGLLFAVLLLFFTFFFEWATSPISWLAYTLLSAIIFALCTWEGGFIASYQPNVRFTRFSNLLAQGMHVLFVDIEPEQQTILDGVIYQHPKVLDQGVGEVMPIWVVPGRDRYSSFSNAML